MKAKADRKPTKICGDCVHIWACSSHCCGSLQNTDASNCSIYERYSVDNDPAMLRAKIKRLEAELLKEQEPGWISVKDRIPESQNPVIVYVPPHVDEDEDTCLGYVGMAYFTSLGDGFWCGTDGNLYGAIGMIHPPTHWMPLPEPPKEVQKDA